MKSSPEPENAPRSPTIRYMVSAAPPMFAFRARGHIWASGINVKSVCDGWVYSKWWSQFRNDTHTANVEDQVLKVLVLSKCDS